MFNLFLSFWKPTLDLPAFLAKLNDQLPAIRKDYSEKSKHADANANLISLGKESSVSSDALLAFLKGVDREFGRMIHSRELESALEKIFNNTNCDILRDVFSKLDDPLRKDFAYILPGGDRQDFRSEILERYGYEVSGSRGHGFGG